MPAMDQPISPILFADVLKAAGIIEDSNRIEKIVIVAKPNEAVMMHISYYAPERILDLGESLRKVQVQAKLRDTPGTTEYAEHTHCLRDRGYHKEADSRDRMAAEALKETH